MNLWKRLFASVSSPKSENPVSQPFDESQLQAMDEFAVARVQFLILGGLQSVCGANPRDQLEQDWLHAIRSSNQTIAAMKELPNAVQLAWHKAATRRFAYFFNVFGGRDPRSSFSAIQEEAQKYYGRPLSHKMTIRSGGPQLPGHITCGDDEYGRFNQELIASLKAFGPGFQIYNYEGYQWQPLPEGNKPINVA